MFIDNIQQYRLTWCMFKQVLVQGWLINNNNVEEFIDTVFCEMNRLENALANTKIINRKSQVHI